MEEKKKGGQRPARGKAGSSEDQPEENLEAGLKIEVDEEAGPPAEQGTEPNRAEKITDKNKPADQFWLPHLSSFKPASFPGRLLFPDLSFRASHQSILFLISLSNPRWPG